MPKPACSDCVHRVDDCCACRDCPWHRYWRPGVMECEQHERALPRINGGLEEPREGEGDA
jgi:hypothetical protein